MIQTTPLAAAEMARSRRNYNLYSLINGASYMCLGDTVLILFAVRLNCPNAVVTVLGSMVYFGYLLLPLGKWMTARGGAAQCQAQCWVLRNLSALLVFLAAPVSLWGNQTLALFLIILGAFFIYGFRDAGYVMSQPLMSDICEPEKRGEFVARSTTCFFVTGTVVLALISCITTFSESIWVLAVIILVGACLGLTASHFLSRIRESEEIRKVARQPIKETLKKTLRDPLVRRQLAAGVAGNFAVILISPICILAMKRGYAVSDTGVLFFSLLISAIKIVDGVFQKKIAAKWGPRKLALSGYWIYVLICAFWIFAPQGIPVWMLCIPLMLCGIAVFTVENALTFYFLLSVKKELQVAAVLLIYVVAGVGAGVAGMLAGSLLLKIAEQWQLAGDPARLFRIYFLMSLCLVVPGGILFHRLPSVNCATLKK